MRPIQVLASTVLALSLSACGLETQGPTVIAETAPSPALAAEKPLLDGPIVTKVETGAVFEEAEPLMDLSDPGKLNGLTPKEVQDIMGEPDLVRKDGSVQVMLYEDKRCVLDVVFYETSLGGYFRASAVSARSLDGSNIDAGQCLEAMSNSGSGN